MASYNSVLRHVSMADIKRNTWKLQEQKRVEELCRKEELEKIANKNSPKYSDWRFDLSENMTTQAMTYATTLPAEGDTTLADVTSTEYTLGSGATVIGSTVVLDSNNLPGLFGNAEIKTGFIDINKFTTLKINATKRTVGSKEELRLFYRTTPGGDFTLIRNELFNDQTLDLTSLRDFGEVEFQIRSFYAGGDTPRDYTTWNINSFVFQRRTPITVFVALDSPEATAFVRTGEFGQLTNDEKKKRLQDMLNAGDAYLLNKFGDPFPGAGGDYSFTDVNLPPSWKQAQAYPPGGPNPYGTPGADDPFDNDYYKGPPPDLDDDSDFPDLFPELDLASAKGAGEAPGLMRKGLKKKTGGKTAPMPMPKQPTGGNMPTPSGYDLLDQDPKRTTLASADMPKGDPSKAPPPIYKPGGGGWPNVPGVPQPFQGQPGPKYPLAKKNGKKKQPVVAHYEPEGEVIMERKLKKPQAFFKDKDIKPEFPENPPPPQIKGLHPDLVTGDSVSQRFNKLDPISARAMPRTGIKSVDKKVQIAKKKPK